MLNSESCPGPIDNGGSNNLKLTPTFGCPVPAESTEEAEVAQETEEKDESVEVEPESE